MAEKINSEDEGTPLSTESSRVRSKKTSLTKVDSGLGEQTNQVGDCGGRAEEG